LTGADWARRLLLPLPRLAKQNIGDEQNVRKPDAEPDEQGFRRGEILTGDEYQIVSESDKRIALLSVGVSRSAGRASATKNVI
jgi:hypothetical protein